MKTYDVLVIGGGSVGLPVALFLAKKGLSVGVVEKMPSVGRGQNRAAIGGIRATHSDPAKIAICLKALDVVRHMERDYGMDVDWIEGGYLYPVYDPRKEKALKDLLVIQNRHGLDIGWVGPERVKELVPGINPNGLRGGTFSPHDGSASPLKVADAFYKLACDAGVDFRFGESVGSVSAEGRRVVRVRTDKDEYAFGTLVNAAGADARRVGALSGLDLPVYPDCHEAGITEPVKRFFQPMVVDIRADSESANYYFYQNKEDQVVFCITPEPKILGQDMDNTSSFLPLVVRRMVELYPRLRNLRIRRTWRGLYPMTPDGFPVVGRPRDFDNLMLAVGMCGQGFMLGPGLGVILAEVLVDGSTAYDHIFEQLTLYRDFSGMEMLK
ncbi:MAG: FAD-binding oxidoreductase [Acidobacteria bacterium]|nr:FAD-binding oxidoreductase [Acidobacteriota bacterium]